MRKTLSTIGVGMAMFITSYIPNSATDSLSNPFAVPAAVRMCEDTSWVWVNTRNPDMMSNVAEPQRKAFCRHARKISSFNFNPIPVMDRL